MTRHRSPAAVALAVIALAVVALAVVAVGACAAPRSTRLPSNAPSTTRATKTTAPDARTALKIPSDVPPAGASRTHLDPGPPWWTDLPAGVYRREKTVSAMAVGRSSDHLHPAEGFLAAKVEARVAVRRAASTVALNGPMPEPRLEDLFITAQGTYWALYRLDVPRNARLPPTVQPWVAPTPSARRGRHRRGRHLFEGGRHLFLECDVEGPIANPDWGNNRASAALDLSSARWGAPSSPKHRRPEHSDE